MRSLQPRLSAAILILSMTGCSTTASPTLLQQHCASAAAGDLVEIKHSENGLISTCPPDAAEDCIYNLTANQTFSAGTPDLNGDGRPDQLAKFFGTNYGDVDIVHYLGFVQCGDGTAIKVLEGDFKEVTLLTPIKTPWPDLDATRECAARGVSIQSIKLVFSPTAFVYEEVPNLDPSTVCLSSN